MSCDWSGDRSGDSHAPPGDGVVYNGAWRRVIQTFAGSTTEQSSGDPLLYHYHSHLRLVALP